MEKEKVIFREEYNPYLKQIGYLAIFPEIEASLGRVFALPFYYINGEPRFEPHTEIDYGYMLRKKIVHKKDVRVPRLLRDIEKYEETEFNVIEKIMR